MKFFAETERFILREILPEDEAGIFELDSDKEVHQYLGNKPSETIEQIRIAIAMIRQQYLDSGIGRWAIVEKTTGNFIGWAGLKLMTEARNNHINYYDLGYRLLRKHWNKGIATETANASLGYGFEKLNLTTIYAMADVNNIASNKVLVKAGLTFVETFDFTEIRHNWYSISKGEWKTKSMPNDAHKTI